MKSCICCIINTRPCLSLPKRPTLLTCLAYFTCLPTPLWCLHIVPSHWPTLPVWPTPLWCLHFVLRPLIWTKTDGDPIHALVCLHLTNFNLFRSAADINKWLIDHNHPIPAKILYLIIFTPVHLYHTQIWRLEIGFIFHDFFVRSFLSQCIYILLMWLPNLNLHLIHILTQFCMIINTSISLYISQFFYSPSVHMPWPFRCNDVMVRQSFTDLRCVIFYRWLHPSTVLHSYVQCRSLCQADGNEPQVLLSSRLERIRLHNRRLLLARAGTRGRLGPLSPEIIPFGGWNYSRMLLAILLFFNHIRYR